MKQMPLSEMPDIDPMDQPAEQRRKKKKKGEKIREVIPAGLDIYPYATEHVNWARAEGGAWAILGMVVILIGIVPWWAANWIPVIPPALMRYGVIQYILLFPLYLFNFVLFRISAMNEFYQLALIVNAMGLADEIWLTFVLIYNFYACNFGIYPSSCKGNYWIDILVSIPTILLLIVGFGSISKILFVLSHTGGTSPLYFRLANY